MNDLHRTLPTLQAGLQEISESPRDAGEIKLIVRRPAVDVREILAEGALSVSEGLVGDSWGRRSSSHTADGAPHPATQVNIMNARVASLVAGEMTRWPLAGDQLFVDFDLSAANLPPGTLLGVGTAVVSVSEQPHTGCGKFVQRFGVDAMTFVNSPQGRALNLRGINARVVAPGVVRPGDAIRKLPPTLGSGDIERTWRAFRMEDAIAILSQTPATLDTLLRGLPDEWSRSHEGGETWSPFDVIGHLIHGDRTDWLPRARRLLADGETRAFDPFDRFAQLTSSKGRTLAALLDEFAAIRRERLRELAGLRLTKDDLDRRGRHPDFGVVTLRQLLATWVAHDLDHIAQISRVLAHQYSEEVGPWRAYLRIIRESPRS